MKRIFAVILTIISVVTMACFTSACSPTDSSTNTFEVTTVLPWKTSTGRETMTYKYEKLIPATDGSKGTVAEYGTLTLQLSEHANETRIDCSSTIYTKDGKLVSETTSYIVFASDNSLAPHESYKKVVTYNAYDSASWVDYGYEVYASYVEGSRSSYGFVGGQEKDTISIPDIGTFSYDNEQAYYVVRCATNLAGEGNSGTFDCVNLADSYYSDKFVKHGMIYSVESNQTVDIAPELNMGDNLSCHKVKLALNDNQSGPGTYLYYSATADAFGAGTGSRVLVKITRDQYNVNTFEKTFVHEYTLVNYSIT